jgi:ribosome-associated protein
LRRRDNCVHNVWVPQEAPIGPEQTAQLLTLAALEKKAIDIAILDMRGLIDYADIFVICSATNRRQVKAIAEEIRRAAKHDHGLTVNAVEGISAARWVLVDFSDVVVHVFDEPLRGFYDLDGLWADAPRLPLPEGAEDAAFSHPI